MSANKDITIACGEPWDDQNFLLTFKIGGVALSLIGFSASLVISHDWGSSRPAILTLTDTNGMLVLGGTSGTVAPALSSAQTSELWPEGYIKLGSNPEKPTYRLGVYVLTLIDPSGRPTRKLSGQMNVSPEAVNA